MGFGNLGVSELLVLAVLVLIFFGPRRIPEVARSVGSALREFRRGMNEIRRELEDVERGVTDDGRGRRGAGDGGRRRPGEAPEGEGDGEDRPSTPRGRVRPGEWEGAEPDDAGADDAGGGEREDATDGGDDEPPGDGAPGR